MKMKFSIFIGLMMLLSSCMVFTNFSTVKNVSASTSGDIYGGSGDWIIDEPTVYDGETLTVHGNIIIDGGTASLTFKNGNLTMEENSQFQYNINISWGYLKIQRSVLDVTTSSTGNMMCKITPGIWDNVFISNSTLRHYKVELYAGHDYVDNCSLHTTGVYHRDVSATFSNISYNVFDGLISDQLMIISGTNATITGNYINSFSTENFDNYATVILIVEGDYHRIIKNHFNATIGYRGIQSMYSDYNEISWNYFSNISSENIETTNPACGIVIIGDGVGNWRSVHSRITNNTFDHIGTVLSNLAASSMGIGTDANVRYVTISDNIFTLVKKYSERNASAAISLGGMYIDTYRNHIDSVIGTYEDSWGISYGILYAGSITQGASESISAYNYIGSMTGSCSGISIQSTGHLDVTHNTFGHIQGHLGHAAIGTQIYGGNLIEAHSRDMWVNFTYNTFTDLHEAGVAIQVSNYAAYGVVSNNNIHISESTESIDMCGAILVSGESWTGWGKSWSGAGYIILNNTISRDALVSESYPDYCVWDSWLTPWGMSNLKIILRESSSIKYLNATFDLVVFGQISMSILDSNESNNPIDYEYSVSEHCYYVNINRTGAPFMNPATYQEWINITADNYHLIEYTAINIGLITILILGASLTIAFMFINYKNKFSIVSLFNLIISIFIAIILFGLAVFAFFIR